MADAEGDNGRRQLEAIGASEESGRRTGRGRPSGSGPALDDPARERHPQQRHGEDNEEELEAVVRAGVPVFAPGPADLTAWSRLLMQRPDVEPAICRAAYEYPSGIHGRRQSSRVSRLRALGNGVTPLTAGLAYITLREALDEDRIMTAAGASSA